MIHRKREHGNIVSERFENENGWCRFGDKNCSFIHDDEKKIAKNKNSESENSGMETPELFKRLFDIMAAFGERMSNV
jgi:hypothetical protein